MALVIVVVAAMFMRSVDGLGLDHQAQQVLNVKTMYARSGDGMLGYALNALPNAWSAIVHWSGRLSMSSTRTRLPFTRRAPPRHKTRHQSQSRLTNSSPHPAYEKFNLDIPGQDHPVFGPRLRQEPCHHDAGLVPTMAARSVHGKTSRAPRSATCSRTTASLFPVNADDRKHRLSACSRGRAPQTQTPVDELLPSFDISFDLKRYPTSFPGPAADRIVMRAGAPNRSPLPRRDLSPRLRVRVHPRASAEVFHYRTTLMLVSPPEILVSRPIRCCC